MPRNPKWTREEMILALDLYSLRGMSARHWECPQIEGNKRIYQIAKFFVRTVRRATEQLFQILLHRIRPVGDHLGGDAEIR
jgi:hypothetical protein